jgi:hypothetical protein
LIWQGIEEEKQNLGEEQLRWENFQIHRRNNLLKSAFRQKEKGAAKPEFLKGTSEVPVFSSLMG